MDSNHSPFIKSLSTTVGTDQTTHVPKSPRLFLMNPMWLCSLTCPLQRLEVSEKKALDFSPRTKDSLGGRYRFYYITSHSRLASQDLVHRFFLSRVHLFVKMLAEIFFSFLPFFVLLILFYVKRASKLLIFNHLKHMVICYVAHPSALFLVGSVFKI